MLKFLWGMLAGYIVANIQIARYLVIKGYRSIYDIPNKD
jgi:hypothetical protein